MKSEQYLNTGKVWTKVGKTENGWYVALGFVGSVNATKVFNTKTKRHAMIIADGWIQDYGK
jgi:hypothetical protein